MKCEGKMGSCRNCSLSLRGALPCLAPCSGQGAWEKIWHFFLWTSAHSRSEVYTNVSPKLLAFTFIYAVPCPAPTCPLSRPKEGRERLGVT